MSATFKIKLAKNNQFMFNLYAGNGEIILTSETYMTKQNTETGIASVKKNAPDDARYKRYKAPNEQFYFNLTADNGKVIGTSEHYVTKAGMENGIQAVKDDAPTAKTVDLT